LFVAMNDTQQFYFYDLNKVLYWFFIFMEKRVVLNLEQPFFTSSL
jgi:hypothetical protein